MNAFLVIESFCSNNTPSARPFALFSILRKRRLTLIRSNADGEERAVLSPNSIGPVPGNDTTGFIDAVYKSSLAALLGLNASLTTFCNQPRLVPAGEYQSSRIAEVDTHNPAISPLVPM